ncbi:MAG: hypothetical protein WB510_11820 [Candidatus Sulfotelmatobacter sp.]
MTPIDRAGEIKQVAGNTSLVTGLTAAPPQAAYAHAEGNLRGPSVHAFDNFIYGAPPMAPLLFPNLMVLGIIALWQIRTSQL